ncbi:MAG: zinc-binding dehydrogenase [Actinobacteria bacterium]|nr:zinc-binding dehydrogenase [Actinomycetota bacterium]
MLQAKIISKGNIILENIETPKPQENEVLFKVIYAGICGSDRLMMKDPSFFSYPVVNGHELVGIVESDGKVFKKGSRAIVCPFVCCMVCEFCNSGFFNLCNSLLFIGGTPANGGFAEYITVKEDMLFAVPEDMPDETATLVEPASVAYHGINLFNPSEISNAMVIGVGIIGLLSIKILRNKYNVKNITAVDISDKKLEIAAKNGANLTVNLKAGDWKNIGSFNNNPFISGQYEGIVDYVCSSQSLDLSIANLKKGGTLVITGLPHDDVTIGKLPFFAISNKELNIKGCYCYIKQDFQDVIEMLSGKVIKVDELISARYALNDVAKAFSDWEKNYSSWYKVLIRP